MHGELHVDRSIWPTFKIKLSWLFMFNYWLLASLSGPSRALSAESAVFLRVAVINCRPSVMNFKRTLIANGVFNTTDRFGRITSGDASTLLAVSPWASVVADNREKLVNLSKIKIVPPGTHAWLINSSPTEWISLELPSLPEKILHPIC